MLLLPFLTLHTEYFERTDVLFFSRSRVTRTYPDGPQTRVPPDKTVWVAFNKRMDLSSIEDPILSHPHAVVQVSYNDSNRLLLIEPELHFHCHSRYVSTVCDSARDSQGRWLNRGGTRGLQVSSGSPSTLTHQGLGWDEKCLHRDARSVRDENLSTRRWDAQFSLVRGRRKTCGEWEVYVAMAGEACSADWGTANMAIPAGPEPNLANSVPRQDGLCLVVPRSQIFDLR